MRRIIATEYGTLDRVIEDPGGAEGTPHGGSSNAFLGEGSSKAWPTMAETEVGAQ
jgi:hypothetical protein